MTSKGFVRRRVAEHEQGMNPYMPESANEDAERREVFARELADYLSRVQGRPIEILYRESVVDGNQIFDKFAIIGIPSNDLASSSRDAILAHVDRLVSSLGSTTIIALVNTRRYYREKAEPQRRLSNTTTVVLLVLTISVAFVMSPYFALSGDQMDHALQWAPKQALQHFKDYCWKLFSSSFINFVLPSFGNFSK
jgi:hypothetical protein